MVPFNPMMPDVRSSITLIGMLEKLSGQSFCCAVKKLEVPPLLLGVRGALALGRNELDSDCSTAAVRYRFHSSSHCSSWRLRSHSHAALAVLLGQKTGDKLNESLQKTLSKLGHDSGDRKPPTTMYM